MLLRLLPVLCLAALALPATASADRTLATTVKVEGLVAGAEIEATQGSPTECTRDESYGTFVISRSPDTFELRMVAKSSGVCAVTSSFNTWKLTLPEGGSGSITLHGHALIGYDAYCRTDWTGPYECRSDRSTGTASIQRVAGSEGSPRCTIRGTNGDDALGGGRGDDLLSGGAGGDTYVADEPGRDRLVHDEDDTTTSKPPGDRRVTGKVIFEGLAGVSVTTSQGQPSNCTRDEEYGTFTVGDSPQTRSFGVTIKDGGWCDVQPSHNA